MQPPSSGRSLSSASWRSSFSGVPGVVCVQKRQEVARCGRRARVPVVRRRDVLDLHDPHRVGVLAGDVGGAVVPAADRDQLERWMGLGQDRLIASPIHCREACAATMQETRPRRPDAPGSSARRSPGHVFQPRHRWVEREHVAHVGVGLQAGLRVVAGGRDLVVAQLARLIRSVLNEEALCQDLGQQALDVGKRIALLDAEALGDSRRRLRGRVPALEERPDQAARAVKARSRRRRTG